MSMELHDFPSLLRELKGHHSHILHCLSELALITAHDVPDTRALAAARVRLSKASSSRARFIVSKVYPALQASNDQALHDELTRMTHDFGKKRQASSEHVVRWNTRSIEADWDGYRAASLHVRSMMKERIDREVAILYRPLAAFGGTQGSSHS
jgi:hypothetical protein